MKILECSSKGDKRFSAFYAYVSVFGKYQSIENHYQLSKRFPHKPNSWRDAKGKTPTHFEVNDIKYDVRLLSQFYKLLWLKYLDSNKHLVEFASEYDEFNDIFGRNAMNCQADVIRQYIKQGRESILDDCKELIELMKFNK